MTARRHARVSPALAMQFDLAARIRGQTRSEALREAMEAYAEVASKGKRRSAENPSGVQDAPVSARTPDAGS